MLPSSEESARVPESLRALAHPSTGDRANNRMIAAGIAFFNNNFYRKRSCGLKSDIQGPQTAIHPPQDNRGPLLGSDTGR
jgi:hypothetical protein